MVQSIMGKIEAMLESHFGFYSQSSQVVTSK